MRSMTSLSSLLCIGALVFCATMSCCHAGGHQLVGGLSDGTKVPTDELRGIVESLKPSIEEQAKDKFKVLEPLSFKTQVVAGLNYFVKARAVNEQGKESVLHLRIYQHFKEPIILSSVKLGETLNSPIEHFP